jgi:Lrp/AsnC family leucine-responsive transcriptional regulator
MPKKSKKIPPVAFKTTNGLLDAINLRLLQELQAEPRMAMSELARRVGMSAPAVSERVQRLIDAGVIAGFRMELSAKALGLPVAALVRVRPAPGQLPKIIELAQRTPEVTECYRITGEDCFLMKLNVADIDGIEKILDRFLVHGQTTTSIIQSTPVPLRAPPMPPAA